MELSLFNGISPVLDNSRFNLYYDKHKYKVKIKFPAIQYFRYERNVEKFERRLSQIIHCTPKYSFSSNGGIIPVISSHLQDNSTTLLALLQEQYEIDVEIYKNFINWRSKNRGIRINITFNKIDVYVDELDQLSELMEMLPNRFDVKIFYVEPLLNFQRNCIYHLNPVMRHRVFFKLKRLESVDVRSLREFIAEHECKPSISLKNELYRVLQTKSSYALILNHHYVDLNQEEYISLWALRYPDMIRCVFDIKQR